MCFLSVKSNPIETYVLDYNDDFQSLANSDYDDLLTSASNGIILRPLFVYRKQQIKKQKRQQFIKDCISYLQNKKINPPFQPYFRLCDALNLP